MRKSNPLNVIAVGCTILLSLSRAFGQRQPIHPNRNAASNPVTADVQEGAPAGPIKVGPSQIVDFIDPTYVGRIQQLRKDDGHEHNFYYYRDVWNADGQTELLKSFAPLGLKPNGPSCNQAGDRILVITSDGTFHSYHLPDMSDE